MILSALASSLECIKSTKIKSNFYKPTITLFGVAVGSNPTFSVDHPQIIRDFYAHCYKHRFLLQADDKTNLNTIFAGVNAAKLYAKHLDFFQDMKRKEVALKACQLWEIQLPPEQFRVDFDFQNNVAILQNRQTGQTIIIYGSQIDEEKSIGFGKQLLDTFKPKSILIENSPLQSVTQQAEFCQETMLMQPKQFSRENKVVGKEAEAFIEQAILGNEEAYQYDEKRGIVQKRYSDGMQEEQDMASYAIHFLKSNQKTNSIDDEFKVIFADLSPEEMATAFVQNTNPEKREQLLNEIMFGTLLETTSWLGENLKQGCVKCAPFLQRTVLNAYPSRPTDLLTGEQVATTAIREKHIAHQLLQQATENPSQQNFIAFVSQDKMMNVAKHLSDFINSPETFMNYQRPASSVTDNKEMDGNLRSEMVKTFALATHIHEEDISQEQELPFAYCPEADMELLEKQQRRIASKLSLAEFFGDFSGLELDLKPEDYISESQLGKSEAQSQEQLEYLKTKEGGGGLVKCYPLGFIQGNLAFSNLKH